MMEIKIAVEIAMKFPVKNQSVRAGEELLELGHSLQGMLNQSQMKGKQGKQRSSRSEELQCQTTELPVWEKTDLNG